MSTVPTTPPPPSAPPLVFPADWSLAQVYEHLGNIPADRIRVNPPLGTATIEDAVQLCETKEGLVEWVDGILVEKAKGSFESLLAMKLSFALMTFLEANPVGFLLGEAGMLRILPKRLRLPDVSVIRWDRLPGKQLPKDRVYSVAPNLVVEILSESNTKREMELKLAEYLEAGVRLIWYIDPPTRTAVIHRPGEPPQSIDAAGMLEGEDVLPGFSVRLGEIFERAERGAGQ